MCVPWNISLYSTLETVTKTQESTILKSYSESFVTQVRRHCYYHSVARGDPADPERAGKLEEKKSPPPLGALLTICGIRTSRPGSARSAKEPHCPTYRQLWTGPTHARHSGLPGSTIGRKATTQRPVCVFCLLIQTHLWWSLQHLNDYLRLEINIG